ncbi:hypothetical protein [Sphingomonas sanguinis]|uniref:hypothetical protein n=1 Tax=Sphingomonas sanguinis TaxID=33051 RepID=UPI001F4D1875|nr:hypothetical protein [Sphingomonas sanguinis]
MKDRELAIGRRMDVQLDFIRPRREAGLHRADGVLEIGIGRRAHTGGGAIALGQVGAIEGW